MGKKEYDAVAVLLASGYNYVHDELSYTIHKSIGRKVTGKDAQGKDIVDAMFLVPTTFKAKAPPAITGKDAMVLAIPYWQMLVDKPGAATIFDIWVISALTELLTPDIAEGICAGVYSESFVAHRLVVLTDNQLEILIENYIYQYIERPKKFPETETKLLSALLHLKSIRLLKIVQASLAEPT